MLMSQWYDYYWSCLFKSAMKRSNTVQREKIDLGRFMVPTACAGNEGVVVKRDQDH